MCLAYKEEVRGVVGGSRCGWIRVHGCMGAHAYVFIRAWILVGGEMGTDLAKCGVTGKVPKA